MKPDTVGRQHGGIAVLDPLQEAGLWTGGIILTLDGERRIEALEQGRDVYVVPWSLLHPEGAGCLRLLRDERRLKQDGRDSAARAKNRAFHRCLQQSD